MTACLKIYVCRGHPNVEASHDTTFEATSEKHLTPRGDCIICVSMRRLTDKCTGASSGEDTIAAKLTILAIPLPPDKPVLEIVYGYSSSKSLDEDSKLIVRKTSVETPATIIYSSSKSARDLSPTLHNLLKSAFTKCLLVYVRTSIKATNAKSYEKL